MEIKNVSENQAKQRETETEVRELNDNELESVNGGTQYSQSDFTPAPTCPNPEMWFY